MWLQKKSPTLHISGVWNRGFTVINIVGATTLMTGFTDGNFNIPIWLDNVQCTGSESMLLDCSHRSVGNHDCSHLEDIGVRCSGKNHHFLLPIDLTIFY